MNKKITLTINIRKISQWISKTVIPVAIGVMAILMSIALNNPAIFGGAASFIIPILEFIQKKTKLNDVSKSDMDSAASFIKKSSSAVASKVSNVKDVVDNTSKIISNIDSVISSHVGSDAPAELINALNNEAKQ